MHIALRYVMRVAFLLPPMALCDHIAAQNTQLVVQSGGSLIAAQNYLVLQNTDLQCGGTLNGSGASVVLIGTHSNSFNGPGIPTLGTLSLNTVTGAVLTLNTDLKVATKVNFTAGLMDLHGHLVTLLSNAYLQGEKELSRIIGPGGGSVTASISGLNHPNQFNLENLGAMITTGAYLDHLTISRMHVPATNTSPPMTGIQRTFLIQPQHNTTLNATLRFYYFTAELAGENANNLNLWQSDDGVTWNFKGADTRNSAGKYVEKSGINDFSYWTLSDAPNTSPMVLASVQVACDNGQALVKWQTASETELNYFDVIASSDGVEWHDVGRVPAVNNIAGASYSFRNLQPQSGVFYRLRTVDQSGVTTYSPAFRGDCGDVTLPFTVYPNPAEGQSIAQLSVREGAKAVIQVTDITGRPVYRGDWTLQPGTNHYLLPLGGLAAGTYVVQLILSDKILRTQLIKK